MKTAMRVTGLEDVANVLTQIAPNQARNIMRATVHDMAKQLKDDAVQLMPEDEGDMKAGTFHKRERFEYGKARSTVRVEKSAFYWRFLEYGQGPDRVAHDFFRNALIGFQSRAMARFLKSFGDKFEAALARAARRR